MSFLRITALIEGSSYIVLLLTVASYRMFDGPDATAIVGPIHGIAFLAYVAAVMIEHDRYGWGVGERMVALVASVIPFGSFYVQRKMAHTATAA